MLFIYSIMNVRPRLSIGVAILTISYVLELSCPILFMRGEALPGPPGFPGMVDGMPRGFPGAPGPVPEAVPGQPMGSYLLL